MQIRRNGQKITATLLAFNLLLGSVGGSMYICAETASAVLADEQPPTAQEGQYASYLAEYATTAFGMKKVVVELGKEYVEFAPSADSKEWTVFVEEAGLYNLTVSYAAIVDKGKTMNIGIKLNGAYPYDEASRLVLEQRWVDDVASDGEFARDSVGNDILPEPKQQADMLTVTLKDTNGYYNAPLMFYLQKGANRVTLESTGDAFRLYDMAFTPVKDTKTYEEYVALTQSLPSEAVNNFIYKVQAEHPVAKSEPTLYPATDKSDPLLEPNNPYRVCRNIIGTTNWKSAGQYLEWKVTVPSDGYYKLGFKYKQTTSRDQHNIRKLYIDGEVPFEESASLAFPYTERYLMMVPGNENGDYLYYLTNGEHTIRLEVALGQLAPIIQEVETQRVALSALRQKIVMITSVNPDIYRDYDLVSEIPGLVEELTAISQVLSRLAEQTENYAGREGKNATLFDASTELLDFANRPRTIAENFSTFTSIISTLASWSNTAKEQLVELDYIIVFSQDTPLPKTKASFFQKIAYEWKLLVKSYTSDYFSQELEGEPVEVWINTGRDLANIIQELIDSSNLTVPVRLKLVQTSITYAVMAGIGPDVVLNLGRTEPVNLGMRGALEPLDSYAGFSELKSQFASNAFVPYELQGKTYGIPSTQTFNMLFARTDIMDDLGLEIPQTWDEFLLVNRVLQQNNMEAGLPADIFATLLYQSGGSYFNEEQSKTAFDTPVALNTFNRWVDYYKKYSFSLFKDDYTRFRSGEMPLAIMSYNMYVTLSAAAPEIYGKWAMYSVPGTVKEDGTIDRTVASVGGGTACGMLAASQNKDAAWEFIRWWSGSDTQLAYGNRSEYVLGAAGRYLAANQIAFQNLPWSMQETKQILDQWSVVTEVPEVPGGYYVSRNLDNAFRACTVRAEDNKDKFAYWSLETDKEIQRKREQYGIQ